MTLTKVYAGMMDTHMTMIARPDVIVRELLAMANVHVQALVQVWSLDVQHVHPIMILFVVQTGKHTQTIAKQTAKMFRCSVKVLAPVLTPYVLVLAMTIAKVYAGMMGTHMIMTVRPDAITQEWPAMANARVLVQVPAR